MSFDKLALHPALLQAVKASGFTLPTPIQASAIPVLLAGDDLIGVAGTGTGKTAAFMLPALQRLYESRTQSGGRRTRILVLTPTRELAEQVTAATKNFAKCGDRVSISSIIGGVPYRRQAASLSPAPDIIVATPGRLIDYLENKQINLSHIEMLILDEADRMLDMGFIDDVRHIIQSTPAARQTLMFSATFDNQIANFARTVLKNPKQISIAKEANQKSSIEQRVYMAHDFQHKSQLLSNMLSSESVFKAIVFSATKRGADKLAKQLCDQNYLASAIHGDLKQNQRNAVLDKFRKDKLQILVATDVAARGIDIPDVTFVFNFDFPTYAEDYVHRIGRTGRAGKTGTAISFVLPKEMRHIKQVERFTGQSLAIIKDKGQKGATVAAAPRERDANFRAERDTNNFRSEPRGERAANSHNRSERDERRSFSGDRKPSGNSNSTRGGFKTGTRGDSRSQPRVYSKGNPRSRVRDSSDRSGNI